MNRAVARSTFCLAAMMLSLRCGGGGGGGLTSSSPMITAPRLASEGDSRTASITAVTSGNYEWTIQNGSITSGATSQTVTFTVGTPGTTLLRCTTASTSATVTIRVLPLPRIDSFQAVPTSISQGQATQLTAVFSNGNGLVQPNNLPVANGVPLAVKPLADTVYTLNVTNEAGASTAFAILVQVGPPTPPGPTGTFLSAGAMAFARTSHTATRLGNGKVLVAGGEDSNGPLSSAELYDPAAGTWSSTGAMGIARSEHAAILLADGRVLVAGGRGSSGLLASAELYDPATGRFSSTGGLVANFDAGCSGTLLADGRVLFVQTGLPPNMQTV